MRREHRRSRDLLPRGLLHVLLEQDLHDVRRRVLVLRLLPEALGRDGVRRLPLVRRAPLAYGWSCTRSIWLSNYHVANLQGLVLGCIEADFWTALDEIYQAYMRPL